MPDHLERKSMASARAMRLDLTVGEAGAFDGMIESAEDIVACGGLAVVDEQVFAPQ